MQTIYDNQLIAVGKLEKIVRLVSDNHLRVAKSISKTPQEALRLVDEVEVTTQEINRIWTNESKKLADYFEESRKQFLADAMAPAIIAIRGNDSQTATTLLHGPFLMGTSNQ